jgi:hypothetical protein
VTLQATMPRRAGQVPDGRLGRIEVIVERMPSEGDDHRLFLARQDR